MLSVFSLCVSLPLLVLRLSLTLGPRLCLHIDCWAASHLSWLSILTWFRHPESCGHQADTVRVGEKRHMLDENEEREGFMRSFYYIILCNLLKNVSYTNKVKKPHKSVFKMIHQGFRIMYNFTGIFVVTFAMRAYTCHFYGAQLCLRLFYSPLHLLHALPLIPSLLLSFLLFSFPLISHSLLFLPPCHFDFPIHWPGSLCACVSASL